MLRGEGDVKDMMLYINYFQVIGARQVKLFLGPASSNHLIQYGLLLLHNRNRFLIYYVALVFLGCRVRDFLILYFLFGEN